jgi:hypothetical protein
MGQLGHSIDARDGVIRVVGEGVYTADQARRHFVALRKTVARVRSERSRVKVLVDTSHGAVQTAEVVAIIENGTRGLYRSGDRVALIVASMLHKVQMRRITDSSITELFLSESAAMTWLCAHDHEPVVMFAAS